MLKKGEEAKRGEVIIYSPLNSWVIKLNSRCLWRLFLPNDDKLVGFYEWGVKHEAPPPKKRARLSSVFVKVKKRTKAIVARRPSLTLKENSL